MIEMPNRKNSDMPCRAVALTAQVLIAAPVTSEK
jgi:hypothetical protein